MYDLQADTLRNSAGTSPIAVPLITTVYTKAHKIAMASSFGISVILSSSGSPSVKVEMEVSDTAPAAAEAIADTTDWCIQEGGSAIFTNVNDKVFHKITVNPTPCRYVRLKLTGLGTNPADTTGIFKFVTQQQLGR